VYFKIVAGSQKPLPRSPKLPVSVWTLTCVHMKLAKYPLKQNIMKISEKDHLLLWFQQIIHSTKSFVCLWHMTDNSISWFYCRCKLWSWNT